MKIQPGLLAHYDYFINNKLSLSDDEFIYVVANKSMIFLKSGEKITTINIESIFFVEGEYKNKVSELLSGKTLVISDYKSSTLYFPRELLIKAISIENLMKIKNDPMEVFPYAQSELKQEKYFEMIDFLVKKFEELKNISQSEKVYYNNLIIKDVATDILSNSHVYSNSNMDGLFKKDGNLYSRKIQYNSKRAVTGRIMCSDRFNIQTISHEDERRKNIISKFECGFFVNFDYSSFETRLAMFLTKDKKFINDFSDKDFHHETAKIIFDKNMIDQEERKFAKDVNHAIVFGAGKKTVMEILKDVEEREDIYGQIINIFQPMLYQEKKLDEEYKKQGYIINFLGTFVYPNKEYALFNNYVQSTAADIIARKIIAVNNILLEYKSRIIAAIHDSILVDFHPDEEFLVEIVEEEMKSFGEFDFNLTCKKMFNLF